MIPTLARLLLAFCVAVASPAFADSITTTGVGSIEAAAQVCGSQKTVFITSGTTWTVPSDWCSTNTVVAIGGGGGGGAPINGADTGGGGGAGAFAFATNVALTPSSVIPVQIGTGGAAGAPVGGSGGNGTDTIFNTSTIIAKGGQGGTGNPLTPNGVGGLASASAPTTGAQNGGNGGVSGTGNDGGGGGGGAGGPNGAGANGGATSSSGNNGGSGGGASDGGSVGGNAASGSIGANGGAAFDATLGGVGGGAGLNGAAGSHGSGGGGGGASNGNGGNGGAGIDYIQTAGGAVAGPGGGAGAGAGGPGNGGTGGLYGGGGGGGGWFEGAGGAGANGIIIVTYGTPNACGAPMSAPSQAAGLTKQIDDQFCPSTTLNATNWLPYMNNAATFGRWTNAGNLPSPYSAVQNTASPGCASAGSQLNCEYGDPYPAGYGTNNGDGSHMVIPGTSTGLRLIANNSSSQYNSGANLYPFASAYITSVWQCPSSGTCVIQVKQKFSDVSGGFWPTLWSDNMSAEVDFNEGGFLNGGSSANANFVFATHVFPNAQCLVNTSTNMSLGYNVYLIVIIPGTSVTTYLNGVQMCTQTSSVPTGNFTLSATATVMGINGAGYHTDWVSGTVTMEQDIAEVQVWHN